MDVDECNCDAVDDGCNCELVDCDGVSHRFYLSEADLAADPYDPTYWL